MQRNAGTEDSIENDEHWLLVERIIASVSFRRAGRLKDLLRYLAELSIRGQTSDLTEQHIGRAVLASQQLQPGRRQLSSGAYPPAYKGIWRHGGNVVADAVCLRSRRSPQEDQGSPPARPAGIARRREILNGIFYVDPSGIVGLNLTAVIRCLP
jgi:hypothetical protein